MLLPSVLVSLFLLQASTPAVTKPVAPSEPPTLQARVITAGADQIVPLFAQVRFTTLIRLPTDEEVVEVTCGDKEFWAVNVTGSMIAVKPAKADSATNLNVLTARGTVYAFQLREVSGHRQIRPDGSVTVERDAGAEAHANTPPVWVKRATLDALERDHATTREALQRLTANKDQELQEALTAYRRTYTASLRFPYRFAADRAPFFVRAMWHDGRHTYLLVRPPQAPGLYEIKDGEPALVSFEYRHGLYIAARVLDRGYLAAGKTRWNFVRDEDR